MVNFPGDCRCRGFKKEIIMKLKTDNEIAVFIITLIALMAVGITAVEITLYYFETN